MEVNAALVEAVFREIVPARVRTVVVSEWTPSVPDVLDNEASDYLPIDEPLIGIDRFRPRAYYEMQNIAVGSRLTLAEILQDTHL